MPFLHYARRMPYGEKNRKQLKEERSEMTRHWTAAQLAAMNTRGRTLLISAAAGSGKTATLTERIIRRLTDPDNPGDITRMLIVTFTRAAAAELRERISDALNKAIAAQPDNRHLQSQLLHLGAAHICTIDAFCMEPLKAHFSEAGLPASFRIADEAELAPLCKRVMDDLIDTFYQKYAPDRQPGDTAFSMLNGNDFADLCDALTPVRHDDKLPDSLRKLYEKLLTYPDGLERLKTEAAELRSGSRMDFLATRTGSVLRSYKEEFCNSAGGFYHNALNNFSNDEKAKKAWGAAFAYEADFIDKLSAAVTYDDIQCCLLNFSPLRLGTLKGQSPEQLTCKERRAKYVDEIKKNLRDKWFSAAPETVSADMLRTARMCEVLYDFLTQYDRDITAEKHRRGICDFTDNRRNLLRLLSNPDGSPSSVAIEYRENFDEVYIDEYQDVDAVQDAIFRLIGGEHRFMVGDIKQSIYAFRGADPSVFAAYRRTLQPLTAAESAAESLSDSQGRSIFMSDNFRCDEPVIRVTNGICGHLFRACPESIGYRAEDDLNFSKQVQDGYDSAHVQIDIIYNDKDEPSESENAEQQAQSDGDDAPNPEFVHIANRIAELLRSGTRLANGEPVKPGDIAILMRSKTHFRELTAALANAGIPVGCQELEDADAGQDLLHGTDMSYLLNLLRVLDNPNRDVPLAEVLRAPYPGFSLEDLIKIRTAGEGSLYHGLCITAASDDESTDKKKLSQRAADFIRWLEGYRTLCFTLSAEGILRMLRQDRHVAARTGQAFLYLYDAARNMHSGSFTGVYDFIRYFEQKTETSLSMTPDGSGKTDGYVSIMSIHKSKGLEFPIVFVSNCGARMNSGRKTEDMVFDSSCGLGMKLFSRAGQRKYTTLPFRTVSLAVSRREREDDMRVLYVAMTRARERLYITGTGKQTLPPSFKEGDRYAALSCGSFMGWIAAAWQEHPELTAYCDLNLLPAMSIRSVQTLPRSAVEAAAADEELRTTQAYYRGIAEKMTVPTPTEALLRSLPTKVPASRMVANMVDKCVYFSSDLPVGDEDQLPDSECGFGGCDPRTIEAVRESIRMLRADNGAEEFEMLLTENSRPTAAERGTAMHLFLQFCDYERVCENGLDEELTRLLTDGYLNARTVDILDRSAIQRFFKSSFFSEVRKASNVRREFRFARFVPFSSLTQNQTLKEALENRTLYVQGSVDILCEYPDGGIMIADYKTDRISTEERENPALLAVRLAGTYGSQLEQYAAAVREIYGKAPEHILIYSVPLGEAVEVKLENISQ